MIIYLLKELLDKNKVAVTKMKVPNTDCISSPTGTIADTISPNQPNK
ncbi:hypothetical protein ADIARSV_4346 [Arcticibacter svalbardensis MN12-7]|uniref:Uncharacterized protein n=1 Tax=Arcticibacter svalbardensis MN12-7 TaxID=1150600 RepID=R9GLG1_9SPHI|nr:hypothetical protein ADIARSV_4346 [Arcticibacter svalbardensis MN12-7]